MHQIIHKRRNLSISNLSLVEKQLTALYRPLVFQHFSRLWSNDFSQRRARRPVCLHAGCKTRCGEFRLDTTRLRFALQVNSPSGKAMKKLWNHRPPTNLPKSKPSRQLRRAPTRRGLIICTVVKAPRPQTTTDPCEPVPPCRWRWLPSQTAAYTGAAWPWNRRRQGGRWRRVRLGQWVEVNQHQRPRQLAIVHADTGKWIHNTAMGIVKTAWQWWDDK